MSNEIIIEDAIPAALGEAAGNKHKQPAERFEPHQPGICEKGSVMKGSVEKPERESLGEVCEFMAIAPQRLIRRNYFACHDQFGKAGACAAAECAGKVPFSTFYRMLHPIELGTEIRYDGTDDYSAPYLHDFAKQEFGLCPHQLLDLDYEIFDPLFAAWTDGWKITITLLWAAFQRNQKAVVGRPHSDDSGSPNIDETASSAAPTESDPTE